MSRLAAIWRVCALFWLERKATVTAAIGVSKCYQTPTQTCRQVVVDVLRHELDEPCASVRQFRSAAQIPR